MTEEFKIAWAIYVVGVVVLLLAGWWFLRNWRWGWLRNLLLLEVATVLLVPAQSTVPDSPPIPVLPLFMYQTLFEDGASPEVSASLVFAASGAFAVMLIVGIVTLMVHRSKHRRMTESDQY